MATFEPPTDDFVTWDAGKYDTILSNLKSGPRGRNVFKLTDGTYTESQPPTWEEVAVTYYGGHVYTLSAQEEADLIAAGYGDFITP